MFDRSLAPPRRNARITAREGRSDEALRIIAGDMFAAGFDTKDISIRLLVPEHAVLAALHIERERRRNMEAEGAG
jgi:hypothetical protein